jgi:hypothetical protein
MKVVLSRQYGNLQTLGRIVVFDGNKVKLQIACLELPNLDNRHEVSCIPEGKYEVHKVHSPKFGKCFQVVDVPERDNILFHAGNYASDTKGCILPGMAYEDINGDGNLDVIESKYALTKMLNILPDSFTLYII